MFEQYTAKQLEEMLGRASKPGRERFLQNIVENRTPEYRRRLNPDYDERLMRANCLLAELYFKEGDHSKALEYLDSAEKEYNYGISALLPITLNSGLWAGDKKIGKEQRKLIHFGEKITKIKSFIEQSQEGESELKNLYRMAG